MSGPSESDSQLCDMCTAFLTGMAQKYPNNSPDNTSSNMCSKGLSNMDCLFFANVHDDHLTTFPDIIVGDKHSSIRSILHSGVPDIAPERTSSIIIPTYMSLILATPAGGRLSRVMGLW